MLSRRGAHGFPTPHPASGHPSSRKAEEESPRPGPARPGPPPGRCKGSGCDRPQLGWEGNPWPGARLISC